MKKLFLLLAFTLAIIAISISAYSQRTDIKSFTSTTGDSINDISGTDTTLYYAVRSNSDWSVTVSTGTITGINGRFVLQVSNDGTNFASYPSVAFATADTVKSNARYVLTAQTIPYSYIALKVTKGTCVGKYYSTFVLKTRQYN